MNLNDWINRIKDVLHHDLCVWAKKCGCRIFEATEVVNNALSIFWENASKCKIKCLQTANSMHEDVWRQIKSYMFTLVKRLASEMLNDRPRGTGTNVPDHRTAPPSKGGDDLYSKLDRARALLPLTQQQVVNEVLDGHATKDIAVKLNLNPRRVRKLKDKAIKNLERLMRQDE